MCIYVYIHCMYSLSLFLSLSLPPSLPLSRSLARSLAETHTHAHTHTHTHTHTGKAALFREFHTNWLLRYVCRPLLLYNRSLLPLL